jgi:L-lactate dehydrogenase complex protein LldE
MIPAFFYLDYNGFMTTVQLFVTCLIDSFYPQTGEAIVDILRRLGIDVEFARDQTCCGQPNFNAGLREEARPIVEHTIKVFEGTSGDIVIPSGSCAHMMKHGYAELFRDDPVWLPRAHALASRVYEFTEYLVDKLGVTDLGARWDGTLTYHPSCHTLRGMGIDKQPRALLANVKGAKLVELPEADSCCGFGGIFSVEHPELSAEWLKRKIGNLEKTESPILVVTESGCLMHIAGGLHRQKKSQRVMHIAEVLNSR